jgi:outer membrane protein OmpA-like peptidoglycan-associated protein
MTAIFCSAVLVAGCQGNMMNRPQPAPQVATGPGGCKLLNQPPRTTGPDRTNSALIGGAVGAVAGGLVGRAAADKKSVGTRNGALIGAVAGALAGSVYANQMQVTEQDDGSVKLNIPGKVLFALNSSRLSPEFQSTLDSVSDSVIEFCGVNLQIVGHTDNTGKRDYNYKLSLERATSVQAYLLMAMRNRHVNDRTIDVSGAGPDQPVELNTTEEGRAQNRRVEIFFVPPAP